MKKFMYNFVFLRIIRYCCWWSNWCRYSFQEAVVRKLLAFTSMVSK